MTQPKATPFSIDKEDYEQERHIFDHCRWVGEKLAEIRQSEYSEQIYFERLGENVKCFIEEAKPIASLGLYLYRPWREVFVRCLTGDQPFDGEIRVVDQDSETTAEFRVEVVTTETEDSVKRRQALSVHGSVFGAGPITRTTSNERDLWGRRKKQVISQAEARDVLEDLEELKKLAFDRAVKKLEKGYDARTAILVTVDELAVPLATRAELKKMTFEYLQTEKPEIYGIFYAYSNFAVDEAKSSTQQIHSLLPNPDSRSIQ